MNVIAREQHQTTSLPARNTLTIVAAANSAGTIVRLGDSVGDPQQDVTSIAAGETKLLGPYPITTRWDLICAAGSLSFDYAAADFPQVTSDINRICKVTQQQYDALSPADPSTLYIVVG
jgi:hypothetical protein